jgi:hypothetical protein
LAFSKFEYNEWFIGMSEIGGEVVGEKPTSLVWFRVYRNKKLKKKNKRRVINKHPASQITIST